MAQIPFTTTNSPDYGYGLTQEQMIELIRTHHPAMLENEARVYLNQALREFTKKTKILRGVFTKAITANTRWYQIDDEIVSINIVYFDDNRIKRLQSVPEKDAV
tara:strand:+ start:478 stop:789 length:312 start_codon:yes stop_codon:yes gene_type:complete